MQRSRSLQIAHAALFNAMCRAGMIQCAMFEEMRVRHIERTDNADPLRVGNIPIGSVAYGSLGTSAVHVAGSVYLSECFLPRALLATGLGILNGATVGTDNLIFAIYDAAGNLRANSALAGVLSAGANAFQEIAFTAPVRLRDGRHYLAVQCNGVTATTRRIAASTYLNRASVVAGAFGTIPSSIAVPSTFAADAGPIGYVY